MMVNHDNYEAYILMHVDGELDAAEEAALQAFLSQYPELRGELDAYESVKLTPDTTRIFTQKEQLLQPVPAGRTISFGGWRQYSAAAGLLLLLGITAFWALNRSGSSDTQTTVTVAATNKPAAIKPSTLETVPGDSTPQEATPTMPQNQPPTLPATSVAQNTNPKPVTPANPVNQPSGNHSLDLQPERQPELLAAIGSHPLQPVAQSQTSVAPTQMQPVPELTDALILAKEAGNPSSLIPVSDEKLEGIQLLRDDVKDRIKQVKAVRDNLKETRFALKLGDKQYRVF